MRAAILLFALLLMNISADGMKAHLKTIFQKLHAADRTEAVAVATQRGYLSGD